MASRISTSRRGINRTSVASTHCTRLHARKIEE
jgi:hypothetical protein